MKLEQHTDKKINHLVFFWLNNPTDKNDSNEFENAVRQLLKTCVYAKNNHLGKPASAINRPVVDTSYSYCLNITFKNMEEHDNYQSDPAHRLFISEAKHLWKEVLIYDAESIL